MPDLEANAGARMGRLRSRRILDFTTRIFLVIRYAVSFNLTEPFPILSDFVSVILM